MTKLHHETLTGMRLVKLSEKMGLFEPELIYIFSNKTLVLTALGTANAGQRFRNKHNFVIHFKEFKPTTMFLVKMIKLNN